jgi:hypothetical protein
VNPDLIDETVQLIILLKERDNLFLIIPSFACITIKPKMKNYLLLIAFSTVFLTFSSYGQVYEKIYDLSGSEVQNHMNQNKISGIDILSGVKAHHVIGLSGINISQKAALETLLTNDPRVISFVLSEDVTSLVLESQAVLTKEEFQALIQTLNGIITGYAAEYSI